MHVKGAHTGEPLRVSDPLGFAIAMVENGANFAQGEAVFLWNDVLPPSAGTLDRTQKKVSTRFSTTCAEDYPQRRKELADHSIISCDVSWSHWKRKK
jgi:hypothetical protein